MCFEVTPEGKKQQQHTNKQTNKQTKIVKVSVDINNSEIKLALNQKLCVSKEHSLSLL